MKNKTININDLEGFDIVTNLSSKLVNNDVTSQISQINKRVNVLDELFTQYLKNQNELSSYIAKSQDYVNNYVKEQLINQEIFQAYVEREIFLNQNDIDITRAQLIAIGELPWWKRTKKNIRRVEAEVADYFKEKKIEGLREIDKRIAEIRKKRKENA